MMLHLSAISHPMGAKLHHSQFAAMPKFQGLDTGALQKLAAYREVANQSPRELVLALEKMLEDSFMQVYERYKTEYPTHFEGPGKQEPGKIDFVRMAASGLRRWNLVEKDDKFRFYQSVLIDKLTEAVYLNKPGNSAAEIQSLLESLPLYGSPQFSYSADYKAMLEALGRKFILEAHKNALSMP